MGRHKGRHKGTIKDQKQDAEIKRIRNELAPEVKAHLTQGTEADIPTSITAYNVSIIPSGINVVERVGNKVKCKKFEMNAFVRNNQSATQYLYRLIVAKMKGPVVATPSTVLLNPENSLGWLNTQSEVRGGKIAGPGNPAGRYHILYDSGPMVLHPWSGTATGYVDTLGSHMHKIRIPLNHTMSFATDATASPTDGGVYVYILGNGGGTNLKWAFETRLSYTDA